MKKITFVLALFACCQLLNAQSKNVDSFNSIEVSGSISAELVQSKEEKVEYKITKGDADNLVIKNKGNSLIVTTKGKLFNGAQTSAKVVIYYKSLMDLEVSSGCTVSVKDHLKADKFHLVVSSGSTCSMAITTDILDLEVSSGSTITLDGSGERADIEVSSGSSLRAPDFVLQDVNVEVSSGSSAQLEVAKSLIGEVSSGSTLRYSGDPSKVDVEKDISSNVNTAN